MLSFCVTKKSHAVLCGIFFMGILIAIDQYVKWFVLQSQSIESSCNYGIAMGVILPQFVFVLLWSVIMMCVVYFWIQKLSGKFLVQLPYILILSGGLSNTIDRFYYGCVVDYIPFLNISSFNIADAFITVGAALILWQSFGSDKKVDENV